MSIDFYGSRMSHPCRSVLLVAKRLKIDLNEKTLDMKNGEHLKPDFLKVSYLLINIIFINFCVYIKQIIK